MARPKKDAQIDLSRTHELSVGLIERLTCPDGLRKAALRDKEVAGLRVRVTANGAKAFVYEAKLRGKVISWTIGPVGVVSIKEAQGEALRLAGHVNRGEDPRDIKKAQAAEKVAQEAHATAQATTVGDLWPTYLSEGKPKRRDEWKPRYLEDLTRMANQGGQQKVRGKGVTRPGPLLPLLALPLVEVNEDTLKAWHDNEAKASKHQAARALMMFRGFLRWCATKPEYRGLVDAEAGKAPALLESLPSMKRRTDALEAAQVAGWWSGVEQLGNRTASAYLRALLLTGARREEMAAIKWEDVDFRWRKLTLADKVDATRTIPLTPYLAQLLASLPRVKLEDGTLSPHVFASTGKAGRIADARGSHAKALLSAGIEGLTIHGLRRSFSLLGEAAGAPAGAIAQVMGHKPSATAEGYRPRSVDALRPFLALIEAHVLGLAGVQVATQAEPGKLRVISAL
jgi:integrase